MGSPATSSRSTSIWVARAIALTTIAIILIVSLLIHFDVVPHATKATTTITLFQNVETVAASSAEEASQVQPEEQTVTSPETADTNELQNEPETEPQPSYDPTIESIDVIRDPGTTVTGFTLLADENLIPSFTTAQQQNILQAIRSLSDNDQTVSFCILNLETGGGAAYNIDEEIYGASSFKGPYFIYVCEEVLEPGALSFNAIDNLATELIVYSDNDAFYVMHDLCDEYAQDTLETWLANKGIDLDLPEYGIYPTYSVRNSLKLWMEAYLYFDSGDPDIVAWAQDLFSRTNYSILRNVIDPATALETSDDEANAPHSVDDGYDANDDVDGGSAYNSINSRSNETAATNSNISVYNKAGWLDGYDDDALIDAGIVVEGDDAYLISIMTSAPDTEENRVYIEQLAETIWDIRSAL